MTETKHRLRSYKGCTMIDAGPESLDDSKIHVLQVYGPSNNLCHSVLFDLNDGSALNKAIEQAKEWIDKNQGTTEPVERYSDKDLAFFLGILDKKVDAAYKELHYLTDLIGKKKIAKHEGTSEEIEQLERMQNRQAAYIDHLKAAQLRIENGTYGICKITGKLIDKARLTAVPHATMSIEGKAIMAKQSISETVPPIKEKSKSSKSGVKKHQNKSDHSAGNQSISSDRCKNEEENSKLTEMPGGSSNADEGPKIKVTDTRAISNQDQSQNPTQIIMDFFKQLAAKSTGPVDLSMRILQADQKLSVEFIPGTSMKLKPIVVTGTPDELDEGFFGSLLPAIDEIKGLVSNIEQIKEDAKKQAEDAKNEALAKKHNASKPEVKTTPKKSSPKKPSVPKKKASSKKTKVAEQTPVSGEATEPTTDVAADPPQSEDPVTDQEAPAVQETATAE
jgi:PRTRC genetic system protein E